jgi:hypothetical protein
MEGPIYKFFRVRWTQAGHQLSPAERNELLAKEGELRNQLGLKNLVLCDSGWSNELWMAFGVHEYPNMDAVVKHYQGMLAIDLFRYMDSESMMGTPFGG